MKALEKRLGLREDKARLMKEDFLKGKLSRGTAEKIKDIFQPIFHNWLKELEQNLTREVRGIYLPQKEVALYGGYSALCRLNGESPPDLAGAAGAVKNFRAHCLEEKDLPLKNKSGSLISQQIMPSIFLGFSK